MTLAYGSVLAALTFIGAFDSENMSSSGAVMLVMMRALGYGQAIQQGSASLAQTSPFLDLIEATVQNFEDNPATCGNQSIESIDKLSVEKISFAYRQNQPVLQDISFTLKKGCAYGIIGPSGSGKSTLVQLLLGIRDPINGLITVNGLDLREIDRNSWSSKVSYVPQDATLITGTVAENIRFFRPGISDNQLIRAAQSAHLLDEIERLPQGFNTHLGERGLQLSGGQRQRLSIARALVGNPKLLVLDEPTSALDMRSESLIRNTIISLQGSVTVVIIAHRISTLNVCDELIMIQDGQLKAIASPSEMAKNNDFYKEALRLSNIQTT